MMDSETKRIEAYVSGRVQGVSFRYYTLREARRLGLAGWVRNERDGRVHLVAEGPEAALESLVSWLHQGSPAALVRDVAVTWQPVLGDMADFRVSYV